MEIHTACLSEGIRYERSKAQPYQARFYILDILPRKLLLAHKTGSPVSCSFIFSLRDKAGSEYSYVLDERPVASLSSEAFLQLKDEKNQPPLGLIEKSALSGLISYCRTIGRRTAFSSFAKA